MSVRYVEAVIAFENLGSGRIGYVGDVNGAEGLNAAFLPCVGYDVSGGRKIIEKLVGDIDCGKNMYSWLLRYTALRSSV